MITEEAFLLITLEKPRKLTQDLLLGEATLPLHLTFPDYRHPPAYIEKGTPIPFVAFDVGSNLRPPEFLAGARPAEKMAVMAVPETPAHLDNGSP